ncbi:hypothetical protein BH09BAC1_BH09BAC1_03250 [soil metagenome]
MKHAMATIERKRMKKAYIILALLFWLLLPNSIQAQITANPSSGCAPLSGVQFTGVSGATNPTWDFGNSTSSNLANPSATFSTPGTYTVTYNATVGGSPVTYTTTVRVYASPTANFRASTDTTGCAPFPVTFQDQSTSSGGATITQWEWAFGDGVTGTTGPNISHTYTLSGRFSVTLKVTDSNGCVATRTRTNQITTSKKPTVVITNSPVSLNSCTAPFSVTFSAASSTSNSPTGTALTYNWNFGNGTNSTLVNPPTVTYNALGTYTVTLKVTDNVGCDTTVTRTVLVNKPVASFYAQGAVRDSVCTFVKFVNQTLGASVSYQYGDGGAGTADTHTYQIPGTYQVTMFAFAGGCADDTTITIHVTKPIAAFDVLPVSSCDTFVNLRLLNQSTTPGTASWSVESMFGTDSYTGNTVNHTYSLPDTTPYVIYDTAISFTVKLTLTNNAGCRDTLSKTFSPLWPLTARFMPDTIGGCAPLKVTVSDSSVSSSKIIRYDWYWGDGTSNLGTDTVKTHIYTQPGAYKITLVIQNQDGCIDTSIVRTIYVRGASNPNFSFSNTVLCIGDTLKFTDLTPVTDSIDSWYYNVNGLPIQNHCPGDQNATWVVNTMPGTYPLSLEASRNGCSQTATKVNAIQVKGPFGRFEIDMDCATPYLVKLNAITNNVDSFVWNFGDGTIINTSTNTNPSHTYAATGNYRVSLTVFNRVDGCVPQLSFDTVKIRDLSITLPPDFKVCKEDTFSITASAPVDVFGKCSRGYLWDFEPTAPLLNTDRPSVKYAFNTSGVRPMALYVRDENGCWDTVRTTIKVYGIDAAIGVSDTVGCLPLAVNFTDQTVSDTTVGSWFWWFGDLGVATTQNPSHTYTGQPFGGGSTYNVFMVARDLFGCIDTAFATIRPSIPSATFSTVGTRFICTGDSVKFQASVSNYDTYSWNFGDNSGPSADTAVVVHYYTTPGTYNVTLNVVDSVGCPGTQTINQLVVVQGYPVAGFTSTGDTSTTLCYPIQLNFTDTTQGGTLIRYWDLGTGSPVQPDPTVGRLFTSPGMYDVKLIVQTTFGCKDTVVRTFNIEGPRGDFNLSPNAICKGESITFTIKDTSDVAYYTWDFGDGNGANQQSPITHQYNYHPPSGQTSVTLVMFSTDSACAVSVQKPITIHRVIADFERNAEISLADTAHCLGSTDVITNTSIGANQWNWTFGNGQSFSGQNPPDVTYTTEGTYTIKLAVRDQTLGCVDTITKTLEVFPRPSVTAQGGSMCQDASIQLTSTVVSTYPVNYYWTPASTLSDSSVANPTAMPLTSTNYQIIVADSNSCADTAIASVVVLIRPPAVEWDTLIVIGERVNLNVDLGSGYTYLWTPTEGLSCTDCATPVARPLEDREYTVTISDTAGCFVVPSHYRFVVKPETTIDVPTAFTPNADGNNDLIFVRGWGIQSLVEFKIYNRWGQLIFETNDINQGWDGTFNGKPQNSDSYTYHAVVETWLEVNGKYEVKEKTGSFSLLR